VNNFLGSQHIAQIGIIVKDVEKTAKIWADTFGLPMPEIKITDTVDKTEAKYRGKPTSAGAKLAFFNFDNIQVELIEPFGTPSTWNDQLQEHGDSLHHIAFKIKGMQQKIDGLEKQGIDLIQKGEYVGGRYAYLDSGKQLGLILELLEND
jgi:methylmalonyl-CoA/ethylmalonyl-CoA epimerase